LNKFAFTLKILGIKEVLAVSELDNNYIMASNILYYLNKHHKDRNDLCRDLGLKYTTVSNWLQGTRYPRIDKIEKMAKYFGVTKADLVEPRAPQVEAGFALRLKNALAQAGINAAELSEKTGIGKAVICEYLLGTCEPKSRHIYKIADCLKIPPKELLYEKEPSVFDVLNSNARHNLPQRKIPLLGKVAAGAPIYADDHVEGYEFIESKYIDDGFDYFALRVAGHSMEPTIQDGDVVIVRQQDTVDSGQIAIVLIDGEDATAKEVRIDNHGITLVGHNVSAYSPQYYTNQQVAELPVRIIGLVIEVRRKLV
jgi:repressor LexA